MSEQIRLPMVNTSAPPATRAECAQIARPCNRYSCTQHLWVESERSGRPYDGCHPEPNGVSRALSVGGKPDSCALDVLDRVEPGHEMSYEAIGLALEIVPERARQLEHRGMAKMKAVRLISEHLEALPHVLRGTGAEVEIVYPRSDDSGAAFIVLMISVDGDEMSGAVRMKPVAPASGVATVIRRRKG